MMNPEKEGLEREREEKAIRAQREADFEHLLKNTHPSLRSELYLGDINNGSCHSVSDYAAQILEQKFTALEDEVRTSVQELKGIVEGIRLQVLADATPEHAENDFPPAAPITDLPKVVEMPSLPPGVGAKAEEFAPAPTPTVVENGVTVLQGTAVEEAPKEILQQ